MSYHSALHAGLTEAEQPEEQPGAWDDDGPPFESCPVCGRQSQYAISGDCWAADCPRTAAINQMDPPAEVWLAVLDTDGERPTWQDNTQRAA